MWLIALAVVAILILDCSPCDGAESSETVTNTDSPAPEAPVATQATRIFPRRVNDDSVTYNVGDTSYVSLWDKLLYPLHGESTEEQQSYTYNTYYNIPSTVNFHDIYSNSLALLADDPVFTTAKEEEISLTMKDDQSFHLNNIKTDFVEFHPKMLTIPPVTPTTIPPPMFLLNSSYITTGLEISTTSTTSTTTEEPEEVNIEVIPIKKKQYQKGLLDLLFPAVRVKTFKTVFDTFRRIMSHTFR